MQKKKESKEKIENSKKLTQEIEVKKVEIKEKTDEVEAELSEAGPALENAKKNVSKIKTAQLREI